MKQLIWQLAENH